MNEQSKYQIIMQGITSNNVAKTCKENGISRTIYYKWYKAYKKQGMEGLANKEKRKPEMPNQVEKKVERRILEYVTKFPEDGPKRIYYEMQDEGIEVGESGIYNVLRRNGLSKRAMREVYAQEVKAKKRSLYGRKKRQQILDYKMKNPENAHPGYMCQQSIHYMGEFPKIGRVYQYVIYDAYSKLGLVKLYNRKSTIHIIDFMQYKIIPLMKTFNFKIKHLVTNQSREFATNWERGTHKYTEFLHQNTIHHVNFAIDHKEIFQPLEAFAAVLTEEFYEQAWLNDSIDSFEILNKRLDQFIRYYNFSRVITDGPNQGRTPADVVLSYCGEKEALPLWLFTRR